MRKGLLIAFMLLLQMSLVGCSSDAKMRKASELVQAGQYEQAIKTYQHMIQKTTTDDTAYLELANVYELMDETELQEQTLKEGISKADDKSLLRETLANYYIAHSKVEEAHDLLVEILEDNEKSLFAYESILDIYYNEGKNDKLISLYESYKDKIKSEYADAQAALKYLIMGEADQAEEIIQNVDISNIKDPKVFEPLAKYYQQINNVEKGILVAEKGLKESQTPSVFRGFLYGFQNKNNLFLLSIDNKDLNGDGKDENILLLSDQPNSGESERVELVIQDGTTGQILETKELDSYGLYELDYADLNGDGATDILIKIHSGGTAGYYGFLVCSFKDNHLQSLIDDLKSDMDYEFLDGFKAEVFSEKAQKAYIIEFDQERKEYYVEDRFYNKGGMLIGPHMGGLGFEELNITYIPELKKYGIKESISLVGPSYNADIITTIETNYVLENGKWVIVNMTVEDDRSRVTPIKFEKKPESLFLKNNKVSINKDNIAQLFDLSLSQAHKIFGPSIEEWYGRGFTRYSLALYYDGISDAGKPWSATFFNGSEFMGLNFTETPQQVQTKLGQPLFAEHSEMDGEYMMGYNIWGHDVYIGFYTEGSQVSTVSNILVKRIE